MTEIDYAARHAATNWWHEIGDAMRRDGDTTVQQDHEAAFLAGAAWQKEREFGQQKISPLMALPTETDAFAEIRNALGTIAEGIAEILRRHQDLAASDLRGADRGVALLKHSQEIGDTARRIEGLIGDKFGVVLDAVKHVGETTEAVLDSVMAEGAAATMEAVMTEPMHAEVKAADYDQSGLGKLWADLPTKLEEVSDETLHDLAVSGQISEARYFEEFTRRHGVKRDPRYGPRKDTDKITIGVDPAHGADAMAYTFMRDGKTLGEIRDMGETSEGFAVGMAGNRVIVLHGGALYELRGMELIRLRIGL